MSDKIDVETSTKVFERMKREGASNSNILNVLIEINPNASDDDLMVFMADCIKMVPSNKKKPIKKHIPHYPSGSSGDCSSSSNNKGC
jgi:hypothetical protein